MNAVEVPFLEWGALTVRIDPVRLEGMVLERLHHVEQLQWLHLTGRGDVLRLEMVLRLGRFPLRVAVELGEMRFMAGWLGFRLLRVEAPGGVRVPFRLIQAVLERLDRVESRARPEGRILMVNLRPFLPPGVAVRLDDLRLEEGMLEVHLGPGVLHDLPVSR